MSYVASTGGRHATNRREATGPLHGSRRGTLRSYQSPQTLLGPPGIRPHAPSQVVRESVYVFAAVAPSLSLMTSLILPAANTAMMNLFLSHVSQTLADDFIVMQVDQAGWHRSKELQVPANIRLIEQPPDSPEANPVLPLWEELREKYLHNRVFPSLDPLIELLSQGRE